MVCLVSRPQKTWNLGPFPQDADSLTNTMFFLPFITLIWNLCVHAHTAMFVDMDVMWKKLLFSMISRCGKMLYCFQFILPSLLLSDMWLCISTHWRWLDFLPHYWCWAWPHSLFWPTGWNWQFVSLDAYPWELSPLFTHPCISVITCPKQRGWEILGTDLSPYWILEPPAKFKLELTCPSWPAYMLIKPSGFIAVT